MGAPYDKVTYIDRVYGRRGPHEICSHFCKQWPPLTYSQEQLLVISGDFPFKTRLARSKGVEIGSYLCSKLASYFGLLWHTNYTIMWIYFMISASFEDREKADVPEDSEFTTDVCKILHEGYTT